MYCQIVDVACDGTELDQDIVKGRYYEKKLDNIRRYSFSCLLVSFQNLGLSFAIFPHENPHYVYCKIQFFPAQCLFAPKAQKGITKG